MDLSFLPAVNAALNGLATILLVVGRVLIARKQIAAHRTVMISAFLMSGLFLISYVAHYIWRASVKGGTHTRYEGPLPELYFFILITHIVLAITVPIFAIWLIRLGLKRNDVMHRKVAKYGWPIWMYVSVTGVVIYFMLYHLQ